MVVARGLRILLLAIICGGVGWPIVEPPPAAAEDVTFYISASISPEDAMYIREGVRLAQNYARDRLGIELEEKTIINAVPAAPRGGGHVVGQSTSHAVALYTGSDGWRASAPFDRVHVVVHEYMHVVQEELAQDRGGLAPLWLDEGVAEYAGYHAVIEAGLVPETDVEAYQALNIVFGPELPSLQDLESRQVYQSQPANVYGLAYLAVKQLVGEKPPAIRRYYERLGEGASWRAAFQSAFRMRPNAFYDQFAAYRPQIQAPFDIPASFLPPALVETPASVFVGAAPDSIERGDQLVLVAGSDAGARCTLTVLTRAGRELLNQPTFADTSGLLFWLWTVPEESKRAAVTASVSCGADPAETPLTIT